MAGDRIVVQKVGHLTCDSQLMGSGCQLATTAQQPYLCKVYFYKPCASVTTGV